MYDPGFGPSGIQMREAYGAIRAWVRGHVDDPDTPTGLGDRQRALVAALPRTDDASEAEMRAVFGELIGGNLAWAYRKTDGVHRMAEYAHAALQSTGVSQEITDPAEREALLASPMGPHLFCTRLW